MESQCKVLQLQKFSFYHVTDMQYLMHDIVMKSFLLTVSLFVMFSLIYLLICGDDCVVMD